jgi:hypothetical protein
MFKTVVIKSLWWEANVEVPIGNDEYKTCTVKFEFKALPEEEVKDIALDRVRREEAVNAAALKLKADEFGKELVEIDKKFLFDVTDYLVDWEHVLTPNETPIKFSKAKAKEMFKLHPYFKAAADKAFDDCQSGFHAKNL